MCLTKAWQASASTSPFLPSYSAIIMLSKSTRTNCCQTFGTYFAEAWLHQSIPFWRYCRSIGVDAAATLTHDIKKAFQNQEVLTALAFEIKGAFDSVSKSRLTKRLWEQNIPITLIRWVASFLNERTAAIRLDGQTGKQEVIEIGVPQGLTVAPILFMLFTVPLFKLFHGRNKQPGLTIRGYVDDELLRAKAQKEELGAKMIESAFAKVKKGADENGMIFDPYKFEAIHFSRRNAFSNQEIRLPPLISPRHNIPERVVRPVGKKASMRWLGVFYDSRLSFKDHANKLASTKDDKLPRASK